MANKKVSQLVAKPSVLVTDLFPIADPTTGQLYKTTISDLGTAIGSGVSSVNTLVGAVVLDTDDIQELASPTNRWFTDTRARAAVSASSPLAYNSGTGVFSIPAATSSQNGYLTSTDWTTFNAKQTALSGTGFVKISGTTISYDNSTYLTTSAAASTYLALAGGTLTGALNGTSANFSGDLTLTGTNPRFYLTDSDNNPDYFISNTDGTFTIYDVTNSTSRFTIGTTGNGTFGGNLTVGQIIRSGGTSAQFLKADGSIDSSTYLTTGTASSTYLALAGGTLTGAVTGTRLVLAQNSADITLSIVNAGTGRAFSVLGTSYFSADISFGSLSNGVLKANAFGALGIAIAGTDYQAPLSGTGFVKISGSTISYDNSTYLTTSSASSTYLALAGGTLTGALNGTSAVFTSTVRANNPAEGATGEGLIAGQSFKIDGTGTSQKAVMYLVSNVLSDTYASGLTAQFANFAGDKAFGFNLNTSGGFELYVKNTSFNKALTIANTGAATFSNSLTTGLSITSGDSVILSGELYWGGTTRARSYTTGASGSATLNYAFWNGSVWGIKSTLDSTGAATFSSSVTSDGLFKSNQGIFQVFAAGTFRGGLYNYASASGSGTDYSVTLNSETGLYFTTGGSATQKMTITSAGNVGIGTTAPSFATGNGLSVTAGATDTRITLKNTASGDTSTDGFQLVLTTALEAVIENRENASLRFSTNATERMRITSDGNVGIGLTNPDAKLYVKGSSGAQLMIDYQATNTNYYDADTHIFRSYASATYAERMRISSTGMVGINTTSQTYGEIFKVANSGASANTALFYFNNTNDRANIISRHDGSLSTNSREHIVFINGNGIGVGNITANGSTTSYNTTSDYRLKQDLKPIKGLEIVNKIKVYDYEWKSNGSRMDGVLAHELAEVLPYAVSGVKDGEQMQGVDYSKIVPVMVQAIKDLKAELDTLKNK